MELREITYLAVALRISAAVLIGGLIGLERGLKHRAAGLRTYMLVCVGACLVMLTNQYIYQVFGAGDPVRMGAQVVSGIGFLGAGTIIVTRRSQIKGLTTAAGLWSSAGVGLALGVGFYEAAVMGGLAVFVVMTLLQRMDNKMHHKSKHMEIYFELDHSLSLGDFMRQVQQENVEIRDVQRETESDIDSGVRAYIATLKAAKRRSRGELLDKIRSLPGVAYLEEM
jgi:putative Mg2+ transporter-C (MgtC) family protein